MVLTKHYLILISAIILVGLPSVFPTPGELPTIYESDEEYSEEMSEKYDQFIQLCKIEYLAKSLADSDNNLLNAIYYNVHHLSMNKRIYLGISLEIHYCPKAVLKYAEKQSQSTITKGADSNEEPTEDSCVKVLNTLNITEVLKEGVYENQSLERDLCPAAGKKISYELDEEPNGTPKSDQPKKKPRKLCKWYNKMKLNCKHCFC